MTVCQFIDCWSIFPWIALCCFLVPDAGFGLQSRGRPPGAARWNPLTSSEAAGFPEEPGGGSDSKKISSAWFSKHAAWVSSLTQHPSQDVLSVLSSAWLRCPSHGLNAQHRVFPPGRPHTTFCWGGTCFVLEQRQKEWSNAAFRDKSLFSVLLEHISQSLNTSSPHLA